MYLYVIHIFFQIDTGCPKNKSHTIFCWTTFGIVSTTLCNVTTFISIHNCIHFWPIFCIDDRRVKLFLQSFPVIPNTFGKSQEWGKVRSIHVWKWLFMLPDTLMSSCSTLSQLEPNESWHCCPGICPSHQGRKKPIDGITWSFSTFRNSADSLCLDLTN